MDRFFMIFCLVCLTVLASSGDYIMQNSEGHLLSRRKRYVVFPQGSTFTTALCLTIKAFVTGDRESDIFTEGLAWALSYDLPNETLKDNTFQGGLLAPPELVRRSRREVYNKAEVLLDSAGFDGRACVLRTLCESTQRLTARSSMVVELLRAIFTLPLETVAPHEPSEHLEYDSAHRGGLADNSCVEMFPTCPVSLLDVLENMLKKFKGDYEWHFK